MPSASIAVRDTWKRGRKTLGTLEREQYEKLYRRFILKIQRKKNVQQAMQRKVHHPQKTSVYRDKGIHNGCYIYPLYGCIRCPYYVFDERALCKNRPFEFHPDLCARCKKDWLMHQKNKPQRRY